jgi:hypothetical protein
MLLKTIAIMTSLLFLNLSLYAEEIRAKYRVSYGMLGEIGIANAKLVKDEKTYTIEIELKATGMAKMLSKNRTEKHISTGDIVDGMLVSNSYKVIRTYGTKYKFKEYIVDHNTSKVTKTYVNKNENKVTSKKTKVLNYYASNDLLTLYFNLDKLLKDKTTAKTYTFQTIGAEKQNGEVNLIIPKKEDLKKYKEELGDGSDWYATAIINQKIFTSQKGKLLLRVGNDGITKQAILKDVIFFGDIIAKKVD